MPPEEPTKSGRHARKPQPRAETVRGVDEEAPMRAESAGGVDVEWSPPRAEAARGGGVAAERVNAEQPQPPVEVARGVDVERQPPPPNGRAPSTEVRRICET